ncbi:MAG: pyruvate formate-lyase-activating protein [Kiritimatiellaeota bacterium]|nr:pyruvate formate-lyase-activating protein [Kiritimatiellota bacterium]
MLPVTGRVHSIETFGTLDGPGIRYVLFLQGCPLRCLYCHNPDSRALNAGTEMRADEVLADILTYSNFIRSGGVTLSGGEPLLQPEFARAVLEGCRANGLHTALDTSGAVPLEASRPLLELADLVLLDIKALDNGLCETLTGAGNADTLATLDHCERIRKPVWIRHVLVPGYTLDDAHLKALAAHLKNYSVIQKVELLPFHKMGEYKWAKLGYAYTLAQTPEPTVEELSRARAHFRAIPAFRQDYSHLN